MNAVPHPAPTDGAASAAAEPAAAFDTRAFRDALGCFPTGVAIITTTHEGASIGLTCNSFSSVSLDPPLVLWSLRRESKSLAAFQAARGFAINVLSESQNELSARFASSRIVDKFEGVDCTIGPGGWPLIGDCVARFECSAFAQHEAGDHIVFIGRVDRFDHGRADDPLVFYRGAYMMLAQSLRDLAAKGRIAPQALDEARLLVYGMLLRLACDRGEDGDFEAIERLLAELDGLVDPADMRRRADLAVAFFELIARAAHNDVLAIVAQTLSTLLHHAVTAQLPSRSRPDLAAARHEMLRGLRRRDADAAVAAMTEYARVVRPSTTSDDQG